MPAALAELASGLLDDGPGGVGAPGLRFRRDALLLRAIKLGSYCRLRDRELATLDRTDQTRARRARRRD